MKFQILIALILTFFAQTNWAAVDVSIDRYLFEMKISDNIISELNNSKLDTSKAIPLTLQQRSSEETVANNILDHWINGMLNTMALNTSQFGVDVDYAKENLDLNLTFKSKGSYSKVNLKYLALQKRAVVTYNGVVDASLSYYLEVENAQIDLSRKIGKSTKVTYSILNTSTETKNSLALSYLF